jgi:hypothetical protein
MLDQNGTVSVLCQLGAAAWPVVAGGHSEVQIIMGKPHKARHSVQFLQDYPAEGAPQYRTGDVEALAEPFASKLVINGYAKSLEEPKKKKPGTGAGPRAKKATKREQQPK